MDVVLKQVVSSQLSFVNRNPCCNKRSTKTSWNNYKCYSNEGLNPCCNGRSTKTFEIKKVPLVGVLSQSLL